MRRLAAKITLVFFMGLLAGCGSDSNDGMAEVEPIVEVANRVVVGNEGGFTYGNSSLQVVNPKSGDVSLEVFQRANNRPLGDVLQDLQLIAGRYYAVLNNSGRIEVIDTSNFQQIGSITNLTSPRYILPVSENKFYVTDFLAQAIHIIDPIVFEKTGSIPLSGWTEELVLVDGEVWVTNRQSKYVYVLDPVTDQVIDSLQVAYGSGALGLDTNERLWVYCTGDLIGTQEGGLYQINTSNRQIEKSFPLSANGGLFPRLAFDANRDSIFFFQNGLRVMDVYAESLPTDLFIPTEGRVWYGMGYNPNAHELWLSDAKDYQQAGTVYRFGRDGKHLSSYEAGIIPSIIRFFQ